MSPAARGTSAPPRVLHVQKVSGIGGSERHLLTLLPALAATGIEVRMVVATTPTTEPFLAALGRAGIDFTHVPAGPDLNPLLAARLGAEIRHWRPDLIHTHLIHADVHTWLPALALRRRSVSTFHGPSPFYRRQPYRSVGRVTARSAAAVVAISRYLGDYLTSVLGVDPSRITVIPYGIDTSMWARRAEQQRSDARDRFGLGPHDVAFGIASRLIEGKGHLDLIAAFDRATAAAAPAVGDRMRLLVAGEGPLQPALAERVASRRGPGRVELVGFVADVEQFMAACDVVANPTDATLGEGFGLAVLEAMAAGRAVIATSVGSLPELVVDGETGLLVAPGSVEQLARAIGDLATDEGQRQTMGRAGAERARKTYDVAAMVGATAGLYAGVTGA